MNQVAIAFYSYHSKAVHIYNGIHTRCLRGTPEREEGKVMSGFDGVDFTPLMGADKTAIENGVYFRVHSHSIYMCQPKDPKECRLLAIFPLYPEDVSIQGTLV